MFDSQKLSDSIEFPGLLRSTQMHTVVSKIRSGDRQVASRELSSRPPPSSYAFRVAFRSSLVLVWYLKSSAVVVGRSSLALSSNNLRISDDLPHFFSPQNTYVRSALYWTKSKLSFHV